MSIRRLINNKYLFMICLSIFSFKLYFNHTINYSYKNKDWIHISQNTISWNHSYAELKHLINNVQLTHPQHKIEIDKVEKRIPQHYSFTKKINHLLSYDNRYTKYEIFTSHITNYFLRYKKNTTIKKCIVVHIKSIRDPNDTLDIAEFGFMCDTIVRDTTINREDNSSKIYKINDMIYLNSHKDIIHIVKQIDTFKNTKLILFTDWRDLYRNNLNIYKSTYSCMPTIIKNLFTYVNCSFYAIVQNKTSFFAIDLLMSHI